MRILYSYENQDVSLFGIGFILIFAFIFFGSAIRELINVRRYNRRINPSEKRIRIIWSIAAIFLFFLMISHIVNLCNMPNKYKKIINDGNFYHVEGCAQSVDAYQVRSGEDDKYEVRINIDGVDFDTHDTYGDLNKLSDEDVERLKNGYIYIDYTFETRGLLYNGFKIIRNKVPVILYLYVDEK